MTASIIYKIMEENPTIQKIELLELLNKIFQNMKNNIDNNSNLFKRLSDQFNIALESIYSLYNIRALKMNNISCNKDMINKNVEYIKSQLSQDLNPCSASLPQNINNIDSNRRSIG
ncbi:hypothetical protein RclHR1_00530020 [Rhizophagus clarus]|uniref:Uncharacterized protein n=1 Tax=Rhizophagus clarus TaxID=94130 RepID=A0A2Z6RZ73_9GLOM|nr:hypothetical protein RclHR1_00530020 [Rhizophagus clarus]